MQKITSFDRRRERTRIALRKRAGGKPRLSVFRSGQHIYAQVIDDTKGVTVVAASSLDKDLGLKKTSTIEAAKAVGQLIAKRAKELKVEQVVFDRGGYLYHGRVRALAEGAREGGLAF